MRRVKWYEMLFNIFITKPIRKSNLIVTNCPYSFNSEDTNKKLLPLSEQIKEGLPLGDANLRKDKMKAPMLRSVTSFLLLLS